MATVQSVERALKILTAISSTPGGLGDLARRTELPLTTTARLLVTLEEADVVTRGSDGVYQIGPAIEAMASKPLLGPSIQAVAQRHIAELADDLDEAVALSIPLVHDSLTILQIDAPKPITVQNWTGFRWPLTAGGSGRVMLATWPADQVNEVLSRPLRSCTPRTITDERKIRSRLDDIRLARVCWSHGEYVEDLSSVAAAIVDPRGQAVASILSYGPSFRFPLEGEAERIARSVLAVADRISHDLQESWPRLEPAR